ncbi:MULTISPECIES: RNA polymerase sigma factor [unclassified Clostridioides]|uniref:RNA polymerase sigma factor n=1 Tax=unclassified Clostridioides TaxID=2635829 RepID=UPI001D0C784D|nr:RNA polymerase sigma factor [Clostridioides sp. ES-S-0123-01]MCC0671989.1 RNA polymerase sigma factor [Clostridioides sp. ES-S-0145-01]MCC0681307.1 RNA polymerase sigma factor [Clostridioides sp. ES-S-0005-03]MCC0695712.1 RNA polymerase sigma factor [Clostridioides sp. ES-S-0048-02]MCC0704004.1 RNA polymerase sigma factor [Clostridioides sp. ES-S-0049-02]MCC0762431.1 RNA polymerase sigma factor [Clostridioides sp. ES-S-0006-03]UDN48188.1 RNA polymerase sigma factor [Clostridioides sp. ES-S
MDKTTFINNILESEQTLYRISKSILGNDQDCEDAVNNAILKAYEKLDSLKEQQYFKTWLIRIVINECNSLRRKQFNLLPFEEILKNKKVEEDDDYSDLYIAIQGLSKKIKIPIVLYYIEGYSIDEIKEILDIPQGTVKSRLSRGRKLLKTKLENVEVMYEQKQIK